MNKEVQNAPHPPKNKIKKYTITSCEEDTEIVIKNDIFPARLGV